MDERCRTDALLVRTDTGAGARGAAVLPAALGQDNDVVYCCFHRDREQRTAFLSRLKRAAGHSAGNGECSGSAPAVLCDSEEALCAAVKWRVAVLRRGYHTYSLTVAFPPYRATSLVAFRERTTDELRAHMGLAVRALDERRSRVLDMFGMPGHSDAEAELHSE